VKTIVHLIPPRVQTTLMLAAFAVSIMAQEVIPAAWVKL
jgi:hypothetical protein